jgi:hypothetical protein
VSNPLTSFAALQDSGFGQILLQKSLAIFANGDSVALSDSLWRRAMMGRLNHNQGQFFYLFCLDEAVPVGMLGGISRQS